MRRHVWHQPHPLQPAPSGRSTAWPVNVTATLPGSTRLVMSPLAPLIGVPTNAVPFAAQRKSPVCSACLMVRSSMSITVSAE
jgi:hypothetical protein